MTMEFIIRIQLHVNASFPNSLKHTEIDHYFHNLPYPKPLRSFHERYAESLIIKKPITKFNKC